MRGPSCEERDVKALRCKAPSSCLYTQGKGACRDLMDLGVGTGIHGRFE